MPVRRCAISTDINNPPGGESQVSEEVNNLLVQGFQAAKEGRRPQAYELFCDVVKLDPSNEYGWLYRAATTDDMAEAYVCLQRVLSINPDNQKAQRGVERIRARMTGEESATEQTQPPAPAVPIASSKATETPPEHDNNGYDNAEEATYNPSVNDGGIVSGMNATNADAGYEPLVVDSAQFNDQKQPESTYSSDYAPGSGYPYPTEASAANNYTQNSNYTPVEAASYTSPEPQSQPQYEQNRYYQPTPIEENQSRAYQPVEEYRYQPSSYAGGTSQPASDAPGNYQPTSYPTDDAAQEYPDFMSTPVDDNGAVSSPKNNRASKRDNFKLAGADASADIGTPRTRMDKPKRGGFGRREEAPLIATFGSEQPTDLDEVGKTRSEKLQRRAAIILLILAILVFAVAGIVYLQHNNNNADQQAANPTAEVVPPPSTPGSTITTDLNNTVGNTGAANTTNGSGLTAGANNTNLATTAAVGTPAPVNPTTNAGGNTNTTQPVVIGNPTTQTTTAGNPTTVAAPPATTAAPATTTAPTTAPIAATTTNAATVNTALKPLVYTVASGDNLTNIAKKFGTTIPAIVAANKPAYNLNPNGSNLFAGNKIIIPVSRATFTGKGGVITQAGDTIASVAAKNNVKPEDLLKFNGLVSESDFKPGDALLLP